MVCDSGEFHWAAQGDRERADANNNTAIIHHPASSDVIKLNYRHPVYVPLAPAPHSPFRGGVPLSNRWPFRVQAMHPSTTSTTVIEKQWLEQKEPDSRMKRETDS